VTPSGARSTFACLNPRLGVVIAFLAEIPPLSAQQRPVFHAETKLVVLQATVRNDRGELVTSLGRDAFTVYENGQAQAITLFRRDDVPVSIGLLIDNSGSMRRSRAKAESAALAFVRASNPEDEIFVLNFADKTHIDVPFTSDVRALERGISRLDAIGGTAMRDAVEAGARYLEQGHRDRKVLLVITDGNDNASVASVDQIRREAERGEIVIYAMGLLKEGESSQARSARRELDRLTELTGGVAYYPAGGDSVEETARGIARQIRNQYTIGYVPAERSLDGSYRKLKVVAKGSHLSVRTRAGYRATSPTQSHEGASTNAPPKATGHT